MPWADVEISGIIDPYRDAAAKGWDIVDAMTAEADISVEADIVIVGSGAGGGTAAETLSAAGFKVVILEMGGLKSSDQFDMDERSSMADLYQEGALRRTKDGAVLLAQGRCVGGGTTVNWCSSFRTPDQTLEFWRTEFGLDGCSPDEMAPFYAHMEDRLNVSTWLSPPNKNNEILKRGAEALNYSWEPIPRNVAGCWDLGYCGVGCPVDAKQSMLVTTIPAALDAGATLIHNVTVDKLARSGESVDGIDGFAQSNAGDRGVRVSVKAKHTILAAGAIGTPAILLRSDVPDPKGLIGARTMVHPVALNLAQFDEEIEPYYGAPQSIYSDEFTWAGGVTGPVGYKLEVIPLLPGIYSALLGGHGAVHAEHVQKLAQTNGMMCFLRDGFAPESEGGRVEIGEDGAPVLDYPITDYLLEGIKRAHLDMMRIQFAAGAKTVKASHVDAEWQTSPEAFEAHIETLDYVSSKVGLSSAHLMGGCAMGENEDKCVVDSLGQFRGLDNLSVFDGSIFPTSLGANPQMSIYGFVRKFALNLASQLNS